MTRHLVLLGDSIFDNAAYVPGEACVSEQLRNVVGADTCVTMLAVDGAYVADVKHQLRHVGTDMTHLVVSAGGNDALLHAHKLANHHWTPRSLFADWANIQNEFRRDYADMLEAVTATARHSAVCTIYDSIPVIGAAEVAALSLFNDVIVTEAVKAGLPIVDLRRVCPRPADYSTISPIEPSSRGGEKIAAALARLVAEHDFGRKRSVIYT